MCIASHYMFPPAMYTKTTPSNLPNQTLIQLIVKAIAFLGDTNSMKNLELLLFIFEEDQR